MNPIFRLSSLRRFFILRYTNSHLEDWIENLYRKIDITEPEQINFERIAEAALATSYNPPYKKYFYMYIL